MKKIVLPLVVEALKKIDRLYEIEAERKNQELLLAKINVLREILKEQVPHENTRITNR
jgi:hypothetical protein